MKDHHLKPLSLGWKNSNYSSLTILKSAIDNCSHSIYLTIGLISSAKLYICAFNQLLFNVLPPHYLFWLLVSTHLLSIFMWSTFLAPTDEWKHMIFVFLCLMALIHFFFCVSLGPLLFAFPTPPILLLCIFTCFLFICFLRSQHKYFLKIALLPSYQKNCV